MLENHGETTLRPAFNSPRVDPYPTGDDAKEVGADLETNSVQILRDVDTATVCPVPAPDLCEPPSQNLSLPQETVARDSVRHASRPSTIKATVSLDLPLRLSLNYSMELLKLVKHLTDGHTLDIKQWAKSIRSNTAYVKRLILRVELAGFPIWQPGRGKYKLLRKQDL